MLHARKAAKQLLTSSQVIPYHLSQHTWNTNFIGPAHGVTAKFSIINISFQFFPFQKRSPEAVENSTDKTVQISWLKSSKTTRNFFFRKSSHKCSHDTWKSLLSTSRRTFLQKYENLLPKVYLYRRKMHFRQHHPSFSNSIFQEKIFSENCSSADLDCNSDNTRRQIRGHNSRKSF